MALNVVRIFDGKKYTLRTHTHTKRKAQEIARVIRRAGGLVRVVKHSTGTYTVYARN